MNNTRKYNYLIICDSGLIDQVSFTIYSFLECLRPENQDKTSITIVTESSLVNQLSIDLSFINNYNCTFKILKAKNEQIFEGMNHLSNFAYLRIFAADYFSDDINTIIYFDIDCWIRQDLSHLFELDLKENLAGGVLEFTSQKDKHRLGLEQDDVYINTGFLIINLNQWRIENIHKQFISCYQKIKEKLMWADQDVFNVVFKGRWLLLDSEYNLMRQFQYQPKIIHFNTSSKPWHFEDENQWTRNYVNSRMTFQKEWIPEKFNFKIFWNFIRNCSTEYNQNIRFATKCLLRYISKTKIN